MLAGGAEHIGEGHWRAGPGLAHAQVSRHAAGVILAVLAAREAVEMLAGITLCQHYFLVKMAKAGIKIDRLVVAAVAVLEARWEHEVIVP